MVNQFSEAKLNIIIEISKYSLKNLSSDPFFTGRMYLYSTRLFHLFEEEFAENVAKKGFFS